MQIIYMHSKIKIGFVSYLNTRPLIYGFKNSYALNNVELIEDTPAQLMDWLEKDKIDIGLVPIIALHSNKRFKIISDYCIAADGEAASVGLFSQVQLNNIKTIYLDCLLYTSDAADE